MSGLSGCCSKNSAMVNVGTAIDVFRAHQAHGFVAELVGMIDGSDAGLGGEERAGFAHGVDADASAYARGFFHSGGELFLGELVRRGETAVDNRVVAGLVDLDEVGAFFQFAPDRGDEFVDIVGVGRVRKDALRGIEAERVFVAAENVDGVATDAQARAGNLAAVDRIADGGIGGAGAFCAHVALGGEAGHQVIASGQRGSDGALRDRLLDGLKILRAGVKEEMDVRVDQAGKQSGITEVDYLSASWAGNFGAGFFDEIAFNENFARGDDLAGVDFEEARGVENDGALRR